jgi:glycosyltransferase involved in cell wall biosynthesis
MSGLRIVLTTHALGCGGTDRVCAHLAAGFTRLGAEVELVAFAGGGAGETALRPLLGDVPMTTLGGRGRSRTVDLVRRLPRLAGALRELRPDVVLSTGNSLNWATAAAVRLAALPQTRLALKITNPVLRAGDGRVAATMRRAGYGLAFAAADRVLTLSDADTRALRTAFPAVADRFATVANPYVTPEMLALAPRPMRGGAPTILAIGRFAAQKRLDLLLRAVARMANAPRVVLLGDGPDRPMLEGLTHELGLAGRVEMPGFVADVRPWLAQADVLALPSRYEGVPAVVLEAMAANLPVVATDCFAAARELVGAAEGCAVADADPESFAAALAVALAQPRPTDLRPIAARYAIDAAVAAHFAELLRLAGRPARLAADPAQVTALAA